MHPYNHHGLRYSDLSQYPPQPFPHGFHPQPSPALQQVLNRLSDIIIRSPDPFEAAVQCIELLTDEVEVWQRPWNEAEEEQNGYERR